MNHHDERLDAYLWDPSAPPEDSVVEIERRLASARFDATARPLPRHDARLMRAAGDRRRGRFWMPLTWAAAAAVIASVGFGLWRWNWPEGAAWTVLTPAGTYDDLGVGSTLRTDSAQSALVQIARIGTMRVRGNTAVTLRSTGSNRHRLALQEGSVHVRVWAPPSSVSFRTPAGEVIDMGCEFELTVTSAASHVRVSSGWVQLDNFLGETLVPAGASSNMTTSVRPAVAVYDDAAAEFREAVRAHESAPGDPIAVDRIVQLARTRDVFTLLQLVQRRSPAVNRLVPRAAELFAPPDAADPGRVLSGDRAALDRWMSALPLPSPKRGWVWNWRDGFSFVWGPGVR